MVKNALCFYLLFTYPAGRRELFFDTALSSKEAPPGSCQNRARDSLELYLPSPTFQDRDPKELAAILE